MRRSIRRAAVVLALVAVPFGAGLPATVAGGAPAPTPAEEHCVVHVTHRDETGQLHLTDPVCRSTRTAALAAAAPRGVAAAAADWAIGTHFDGAGLTGSTLTVMGADCTGGWLNLPAGWSNRISSTLHGCPRIRHFDGYWLVTPEETTLWPGGNLLSLNNRASSIQYLP